MSTVFELLIATEDQQLAQSAAHAVFKKVDGLEELFSRYLDASEVALISRLKPGETFRVAPELMEMLLTATRVCAATQGAFDVTVGPVMDDVAVAVDAVGQPQPQAGPHQERVEPRPAGRVPAAARWRGRSGRSGCRCRPTTASRRRRR